MPYKKHALIFNADDELCEQHGMLMLADHRVGITGGLDALKAELDKLVDARMMFSRITFMAHGEPGGLFWGNSNDPKTYSFLSTGQVWRMHGKGYDRLFLPSYYPSYHAPQLHFPTCRVAADPDGWAFLEAVGRVFLRATGGTVSGHTTNAYGWGGNLRASLDNRKVDFPNAEERNKQVSPRRFFWQRDRLRKCAFRPGGVPVERWDDDEHQVYLDFGSSTSREKIRGLDY